jgi:hypothetical protein
MEAPVASYEGYVRQFNQRIKALTLDLEAHYPRDPKIYRAKTRIMAVANYDPLFVISEVGPYLFKYQTQIYRLEEPGAAAEEFFMANSYDDELKAAVDADTADLASYIIPRAKECARTLPPIEKEQYKKLIVSMLDDYVDYMATRWPVPKPR